MILQLVYKEYRLTAHPTLYLFLAMGAMLLIPAYPYSIVFFYSCLAFFFCFLKARENKDVTFTALLPVGKRDVVKSKYLFLILSEAAYLLLCVPFAVLRFLFLPSFNPVGMEPNLYFFGIGFAIYGIFNAVYPSEFYKTAYSVGKAFLLALIPIAAVIFLSEGLTHFPAMSFLKGISLNALTLQLPFFFGGIVCFTVLTFLGYLLSAKRFERVDL